eukprot:5805404-Alexandrium_andersonii.AAC.1
MLEPGGPRWRVAAPIIKARAQEQEERKQEKRERERPLPGGEAMRPSACGAQLGKSSSSSGSF